MSEPTFDLPELSENLVSIIAPLSDEPNVDDGLSAQQLRNKFDEGGKNIRNFLNNTLSPAIKNFLRSLNTAISNANTAIRNLSNTLTSDYRTASAQNEIDASLQSAVANKADSSYLCYVITGAASPPTSIQAGSYIILKGSMISGCPDGLYTAAQAIPASTLIDATYLTAVSGGGLNALSANVYSFQDLSSLVVGRSGVTISNCYVVKYGKFVVAGFRAYISSGIASNTGIATGFPAPSVSSVELITRTNGGQYYPAFIWTDGSLNNRNVAIPADTAIYANIAYATND